MLLVPLGLWLHQASRMRMDCALVVRLVLLVLMASRLVLFLPSLLRGTLEVKVVMGSFSDAF